MKYMKIYLVWLLLLTMALQVYCKEDDINNNILIYTQSRRSGSTNEWYLSEATLIKSPRWTPNKNKIPLSLDVALKKAEKWVRNREGANNLMLQNVSIKLINAGGIVDMQGIYYYLFEYIIPPFDRAACIILMDGTTLEPKTVLLKAPNHENK